MVTAVIFLLFGALIYRLYYVQISQSDIYTAMAASQRWFGSGCASGLWQIAAVIAAMQME